MKTVSILLSLAVVALVAILAVPFLVSLVRSLGTVRSMLGG